MSNDNLFLFIPILITLLGAIVFGSIIVLIEIFRTVLEYVLSGNYVNILSDLHPFLLGMGLFIIGLLTIVIFVVFNIIPIKTPIKKPRKKRKKKSEVKKE